MQKSTKIEILEMVRKRWFVFDTLARVLVKTLIFSDEDPWEVPPKVKVRPLPRGHIAREDTLSFWQAGLLDGVCWWSGFIHSICAQLIVFHERTGGGVPSRCAVPIFGTREK